jgi:hypothetical protein
MTIPFGRLRLDISVSIASGKSRRWEELTAVGMSDRELAGLNQVNTRDPVTAPWEGLAVLMRHGRWR